MQRHVVDVESGAPLRQVNTEETREHEQVYRLTLPD